MDNSKIKRIKSENGHTYLCLTDFLTFALGITKLRAKAIVGMRNKRRIFDNMDVYRHRFNKQNAASINMRLPDAIEFCASIQSMEGRVFARNIYETITRVFADDKQIVEEMHSYADKNSLPRLDTQNATTAGTNLPPPVQRSQSSFEKSHEPDPPQPPDLVHNLIQSINASKALFTDGAKQEDQQTKGNIPYDPVDDIFKTIESFKQSTVAANIVWETQKGCFIHALSSAMEMKNKMVFQAHVTDQAVYKTNFAWNLNVNAQTLNKPSVEYIYALMIKKGNQACVKIGSTYNIQERIGDLSRQHEAEVTHITHFVVNNRMLSESRIHTLLKRCGLVYQSTQIKSREIYCLTRIQTLELFAELCWIVYETTDKIFPVITEQQTRYFTERYNPLAVSMRKRKREGSTTHNMGED